MELDCHIEKLVFGGLGLARTETGIILISGVLPGERVLARITAQKRGVLFGAPEAIKEPSPVREKAPCPYYALCGGCDFQHAGYKAQLDLKKEILIECFSRNGQLAGLPELELFASEPRAYRLRCRFKVAPDRKAAGFFKDGSHEVVKIMHCPVLAPPLNRVLGQQDAILPQLAARVNEIAAVTDGGRVSCQPRIGDFGPGPCLIKAGELKFKVKAADFFQANFFLLEALGGWAGRYAGGDTLWDLYGGSGFFSLFLRDRFKHGILIEAGQSLIKRAKANFELNKAFNLEARAATCEAWLANGARSLPVPDCVVCDPPRSGLSPRVRQGLLQLGPRRIVYVACDPVTQARDLKELVRKGNYVLKQAALFDFYPQTHHMETAVVLEKNEGSGGCGGVSGPPHKDRAPYGQI